MESSERRSEGTKRTSEERDEDSDARRRIEAEHEDLGALVTQLESANLIGQVQTILAELNSALVDHFANEEAEDGLSEAIRSTAPEKDHALEELFQEHREILRLIESLQVRAKACQAEIDSIVEGSRKTAAILRAHEVKEAELFVDAVYGEYGGGD